MPNILDVARLVEVSPRTVSRVLNDDPRVSARTRKAVLRAMDELGYIPNQAARSLRGAHTRVIGVVLFDLNNLALLQSVPAMEEVVRARGYSLLLCDSQNDRETEAANLRRLYEQRVEGLVVFGTGEPCQELALYARAGVPTVPLPYRAAPLPEGLPRLRLCVDLGLREGMRYLAELGHRRVAVVRSNMPSRAAPAFTRRELAEGLPLDDDPSLELVRESAPECRQATIDLLTRPDRPTAIVSVLHAFSPYVLQGIHSVGLALPEQLSFVSMGDSPWAVAYRPPLTAVRFEFGRIGRLLAEYLFARIDGGSGEDLLEQVRPLLVPRLVLRQSCAPPPGN